jgi:predicted phosphodiesterase
MKIHILSDLHLEFGAYNIQALDVDVITLAGDIGVGLKGLKWAAEYLKSFAGHIIYIAGNHEFYRQDINMLREDMQSYCSTQERLHFLDDDEVIIDGVRFLGATLWTDFELFGDNAKDRSMIEAKRYLNDYRLIFNEFELLSTEDTLRLNQESVLWLKHKLIDENYDGKTVILTHHLPSKLSCLPKYLNDGTYLSACFASNLDYLFNHSELWIHGHTHDSFDYMVGKTRVICNPRGYSTLMVEI